MPATSLLACFLALIASAFWAFMLSAAERRLSIPLGTFGGKSGMGEAERGALFRQYLVQQKWSFGLVWFCVAIGIILSASLVARLIFQRNLDIQSASAACGVVGDLWFGRYAWKIYSTTSKRIESLLSKGLNG